MKIGKSNALRMESINVWRLENGVPVTGEIPIALVIRENDNYIWTLGCLGAYENEKKQGKKSYHR